MKTIKIYSESQLVLLRNINPLLGRYRIPREILEKVDYLLEMENFEGSNYILIVLSPVRNDIRDIEDAVNLYPRSIEILNDVERQEIKDTSCKTAKREWFLERVYVEDTKSLIFVLYSVPRKYLYKNS